MRSTHCRKCGRKLKSQDSIERGYGSYCYKKAMEEKEKAEEKLDGLDATMFALGVEPKEEEYKWTKEE